MQRANNFGTRANLYNSFNGNPPDMRSVGQLVVVFASLVLAQNPPLAGPAAPGTGAETIVVDANGPSHAFPHFWERVVGSGRAILTLRDSYRTDLSNFKRATGVDYVRFHNIFHDEVGIYDVDNNGTPIYNWSYVDQIYDGLIESGVRPFVELSFMPYKLAQNKQPHPFWYKPIPSPPADYKRWDEMILAFTRHLVDRYGLGEVQNWYFEVWNEPNIDFWDGKPAEATYYELYDHTASSVKAISTKLRVGGPATAQAAWIDRFLDHCAKNKIPVDFVSTHVYGNDSSHDVFGTDENIGRADMVARAVRKVYDQVKQSPLPNVEIHWTEYNATYMNQVNVTDSPFMGPWLAHTIAASDGLVNTMSYWCVSDVFEEQGVVKQPFYGGYGLSAAGNIPKAAFNAFALLHRLGFDRMDNPSPDALVTKRADGTIVMAVWNYAEAEEDGSNREYKFDVSNLSPAAKARITIVDRDHGSPLRTWEEMGSPHFPTREEQGRLRVAATMPEPIDFDWRQILTLPPKSLALIEISR
jgi:xylan 1,4-beta-xylosidase